MSLSRLVLRNISGSTFRSSVVFLCALLVASLALSTVLIVHGAEESLRLASRRLGADIVVVPEGTETKIGTALLMGMPTKTWMPQDNLDKIARVPGVAEASPQLYMASLDNASCCSASNMFMVAFDPKTDFTVTPWLKENLGGELKLGEAVGGTFVFVPEGEQNIKLYGYFVTLKGNLEPTGTNLDQSMFLTFETAHDIARISKSRALVPLDLPQNSISAALVKVAPGEDVEQVAVRILQQVPGVTAVQNPDLFLAFRKQMTGLQQGMLFILSVILVMSLLLIGLIFLMATNERRREIGVLRALGATRGTVFRSLLAEAAILALGGGLTGIVLAAFAIYLFRNLIVTSIGFPFLFPALLDLLPLALGGLAVVLLGVTIAALIPALRVSRQDPALAMRE
jgi:putative ABC transport system permease protein